MIFITHNNHPTYIHGFDMECLDTFEGKSQQRGYLDVGNQRNAEVYGGASDKVAVSNKLLVASLRVIDNQINFPLL